MLHTYLILPVLPGREGILFVGMPRRIISHKELEEIQPWGDRSLDHPDSDTAGRQAPEGTGRKPRWQLLGLFEDLVQCIDFLVWPESQFGQMSFLMAAAPTHNFPGQELDFRQYSKHRNRFSYDKIPDRLFYYSLPLWTIWEGKAAEALIIPGISSGTLHPTGVKALLNRVLTHSRGKFNKTLG